MFHSLFTPSKALGSVILSSLLLAAPFLEASSEAEEADCDSFLFSPADFKNLPHLAIKLREGSDPLSEFLQAQFSPTSQQLLSAYDSDDALAEALQEALIEALNRSLEGPSLYEEERFSGVTLSPETEELIEKSSSEILDEDIIRLNRMLLEDAYPEAIAKSYYFVMVFAAEKNPLRGRTAHTFATFVRTQGEEGNFANHDLCVQTISWLPVTGVVVPTRVFPEEGRNFTLEETLDISEKNGAAVYMWGPFQVSSGDYQAFSRRKRQLDCCYKYRAADTLIQEGRNVKFCNCVRAAADSFPNAKQLLFPVWMFGERASRHIVNILYQRERVLSENHPWLICRLGLNQRDIVLKQYRVANAKPRPHRRTRAGAPSHPAGGSTRDILCPENDAISQE